MKIDGIATSGCALLAMTCCLSVRNLHVGNAVPGVPTAEGGSSVDPAATALAHRARRNAGDGVPYDRGEELVRWAA